MTIMYFDSTPGIQNPDVFTVPEQCTQADTVSASRRTR